MKLGPEDEFCRVLAKQFNINHHPLPEHEVFSGNPLKYHNSKSLFETLLEHKQLHYRVVQKSVPIFDNHIYLLTSFTIIFGLYESGEKSEKSDNFC